MEQLHSSKELEEELPIHFVQPELRAQQGVELWLLTVWTVGRYQSQKLNAQRISLYLQYSLSDGQQYYGEQWFVRGFIMVNGLWTEKVLPPYFRLT